MQYAMDSRADGTRFETEPLTQRVGPLAGEHHEADADEVVYVLEGTGRMTVGGASHDLRPGIAVFISRGLPWSAEGDARAVSVLAHDPEPSTRHAVIDLTAVESGTATAGRQFLLGATPEVGCASVTQFVGYIPLGRAPDHFHNYDEVVYVLEGEGALHIAGESVPLRGGSCIHFPARMVHAIENAGPGVMQVLGVFRPAGSPAEAYYPDGTPAGVPEGA
jgi:mannose-6-phosphate isomerase-like protein (cupin superfamily)